MNADRRLRVAGGCLVGAALLAGSFFLGVVAANRFPLDRERLPSILPELQSGGAATAPPSAESSPGSTAAPDRETLFEPFWQAWDIVHEEYVDRPVDDVGLMRGAIQGMLDALGDEHTFYMDPSEYEQASFPLEGDYEGIGAWVDTSTEFLTIISPMPGSPAERVGLKPGDEILAVNGEDMIGVDANLVVRKVLGPAGTVVRLTVRREGEIEPLEFAVTREKIVVPSVESRMLEGDVAYVRLLTFGEDTTADLQRALDELLGQDPVGLVLDLRANGGGFLHTAVEVASEFIGEGTLLIERFGDGSQQLYRAESGGRALDIPLVVLIDGGTASASEIVAGAIQDAKRGLLVGETSFGKGSVQVWIPLQGDGGAVRITTARWYTPLDRLIHGVGLTPDVVVEAPAEGTAEQDPALDKAVELLIPSAP